MRERVDRLSVHGALPGSLPAPGVSLSISRQEAELAASSWEGLRVLEEPGCREGMRGQGWSWLWGSSWLRLAVRAGAGAVPSAGAVAGSLGKRSQ